MKESKKHCAFLRGVNVKGTAMKMPDVTEAFADAGLPNAMAVLATGNILFSSPENPEILKERIENSLSKRFSYDAYVFLKSADEIEKIFQNCPFLPKENHHTYIFVGQNGIEETLLEHFKTFETQSTGEASVVDGTFYWQIEKGQTLDSPFGKILGKKSLKDQFTSRNINTFEKIIAKFSAVKS